MPFEFYDVLGVARNASQEDIKKAYKKLAIEHHPDKGGDEKKFQELSNAYNILSDKQKRSEYDRTGGNENNMGGRRGFQQQNAHDIFQHFFNQHSRHQQQIKKCNDTIHNIKITLEEAAKGIKKQFKIKLKVFDFGCYNKCNRCDGSGQIQNMHNMGFITQVIMSECPECKGVGTSIIKGAESRAMKENECNVNIDIPAGVDNGYKILVEGKGEQPKTNGIVPGNLIFNILIKPHNKIRRDMINLFSELNIDFITSVIGDIIPFNILDIENFDIDLKKLGIIQSNKDYIFTGKGMPIINQKNKRGDLIIRFNINYPILTDNQREQLKSSLQTILY